MSDQILHDPHLLYVAAQFAEKHPDNGRNLIFIKVSGDQLITLSTDGVAMFRAEGRFEHSLKRAGHFTVHASNHLRKPSISNNIQLVDAQAIQKPLPFNPYKVDEMAKEIGFSSVDPSRMAKVVKALSHLTNVIQIHTGKALTTFTVKANLPTEYRVQAFLANLEVK